MAIILELWATPAAALELKLDDAMVQKLGPLCQAAMYGSRMVAEPICQELGKLLQEAQKAQAPPPKEPDPPAK